MNLEKSSAYATTYFSLQINNLSHLKAPHMAISLVGILGSIASSIFSKGVVDSVGTAIKSWWDSKLRMGELQQKTQMDLQIARTQAEIAKIEADSKSYGDSDKESVKQWQYSYKDEVLVYSIVLLIAACFVPEAQPAVEKGIALLNELPGWIQFIIGGTYISVLGLRTLLLAPLHNLFRPSSGSNKHKNSQ